MAMAKSLESLRFFCGECENRGFVRSGVAELADRSHESFSPLRVRCGKKKERNFAWKLAKVQKLVKVQRELVLLSSTEQGVRDPIGDFLAEDSIQIAISNPNVLERIIKNLEDLQAEIESLNIKAKKKKYGSSSFSSETGDFDMAKAVDMQAPCKSNKSAKHARAPIAVASDTFTSISPSATEAMRSVMLPPFHSAEQIAAARSTSDDVEEEEPAIVAQIRALCSTANSPTRETFSRGPIELKDTPVGRVIVDTISTSLPSLVIPFPSTSGTIEVCTVGKCRRGGSQEILASLQGCIPESFSISVTECKCMGKCKSAPNVRVKNSERQVQVHNYVSVDDIDTLLELHFGVQAPGRQSSAMPLSVPGIDSGVPAA